MEPRNLRMMARKCEALEKKERRAAQKLARVQQDLRQATREYAFLRARWVKYQSKED